MKVGDSVSVSKLNLELEQKWEDTSQAGEREGLTHGTVVM